MITSNHNIITKLCELAGVSPDQCRRVILDAPAGEPVTIYAEMYASDKILELEWSDLSPIVHVLDKAE
jgi:hypothetical protein